MELRQDIGFDQLKDDSFQVILTEEGETRAVVYGSTVEECDEKAKAIVQAVNSNTKLLNLLEEVKTELMHHIIKLKDNSIFYKINTVLETE